MSDSNSPDIPTPQTITVAEPARPAEIQLKRCHIVAACGAGLIACFFLPWIQFLWVTPSGLDISKLTDYSICLWAMPVFAGFAVIGGIMGKDYREVAQLAAVVPFVILCYGFSQIGENLFKGIAYGGWIALGLAVILFIAARK